MSDNCSQLPFAKNSELFKLHSLQPGTAPPHPTIIAFAHTNLPLPQLPTKLWIGDNLSAMPAI